MLKTRAARVLFDDEYFEAKMLHKPYKVVDELLKSPSLRPLDARKAMMALAMAQSIEAPLRPSNQRALLIGKNIYRVKRGNNELLIPVSRTFDPLPTLNIVIPAQAGTQATIRDNS